MGGAVLFIAFLTKKLVGYVSGMEDGQVDKVECRVESRDYSQARQVSLAINLSRDWDSSHFFPP